MFEKVNPAHPDKVADRIAGAIVDLAYKKQKDPKVAVEVLIGHGLCHIVAETSAHFENNEVAAIAERIGGPGLSVDYCEAKQDPHLAENQKNEIRCGDNGIFRGVPTTDEQQILSHIARDIYDQYGSDGKYILVQEDAKIIVCQSNVTDEDNLRDELLEKYMPYREGVIINPLGFWTGGTDADTGATNRKLGSDMGDAVTGGGLHGKDLSKADVSVNIYAHLKAQEIGAPVELFCAIGDDTVDGKPYREIVEIARQFINGHGGFEKFAEWGLI